jgi:hypothetical protein
MENCNNMNVEEKKGLIHLYLSKEEALVLLEWLSNFNEKAEDAHFDDQAERRILFDLEAVLEKTVPEVFTIDYKNALIKARTEVRDM